MLRLLQSSDYADASRLKINGGLAQELERIMSIYLKYLLEKEVKSVAWMESLKEQRLKLSQNTLP